MSITAGVTVVSLLADWWKSRSESKQRIKEAQTNAEIERINKGMADAGWKDEWILLLISFPYIMAFIPIPSVRQAANDGFSILNGFPDWWKISFLSIVGAVYGIKKLRTFQWGNKNG